MYSFQSQPDSIFSPARCWDSLSLVSNECKWHRFSVVPSSSFMWSKASSMIHLNVNKMLEKFCSEFSFYLLFKFQAVCYVAMRKAFYLSWLALHVGIEAKTTSETRRKIQIFVVDAMIEWLSSCRRRLETLITQSNNRTRIVRKIRARFDLHTTTHACDSIWQLPALAIKCLFHCDAWIVCTSFVCRK